MGGPVAIHDRRTPVWNSTTATISGTADVGVLHQPLWFEVRAEGGSGPLIDYGAFPQKPDWSFQARHLRFGENQVTVFWKDAGGQCGNAHTILFFPASSPRFPAVRPRPRPAEIWWGRMFHDEMLPLKDAGGWPYVAKWQDAYFVHSAGFTPEGPSSELLRSLVATMEPHQGRFAAELGGGTEPDDNWPGNQVALWGGWAASIETLGIAWTEITHDFQPHCDKFCKARPDWDERRIADWVVDMWGKVFKGYYDRMPHVKASVTQSPVWWPWGQYPALGDRDCMVVHLDGGCTRRCNMQPYMEGLVNVAGAIGHPQFGFHSDYPYYALNWGCEEEKVACQQKILAYEHFLHSRSSRHCFLCMGPNQETPNSDAWDRKYKDESIAAMILWQALGGRADTYNFESFYGEGPHTVIPESNPISYTGLVYCALRFMKGYTDVEGHEETLELKWASIGHESHLQLTNTGGSPCMPALLAMEHGMVSGQGGYRLDGQDITQAMRTPEGYTFTGQLQPGQSVTIVVTTPGPSPDNSLINIEAYWNPQDPTGLVRDRALLILGGSQLPQGAPQQYMLRSVNTGLALDVEHASKEDGAPIVQWDANEAPNQLWTFDPVGNGSYRVLNVGSGKCLEVNCVSREGGARIQQFNCWNGPHQRWFLIPQAHGSFELLNAHSGLAIDVDGQSRHPGALHHQTIYSDAPTQQFTLHAAQGQCPA
ncbi:hypothetical protein WJX84_011175 [Apatococcus fuscideae]|uniref:Ricin B lectin domain-containing protein n=1 Tax=Apatococcus fuscideae TaxID=2026836 RepID=A0AAW1TEM8_9CHLO